MTEISYFGVQQNHARFRKEVLHGLIQFDFGQLIGLEKNSSLSGSSVYKRKGHRRFAVIYNFNVICGHSKVFQTFQTKPAFFIIGMVKAPVDTVLAIALPEMEPNRPEAMTDTLAGPPILWPTAASGNSTKKRWAPHFSKNAPNMTNRMIHRARIVQ